MNTLTTLTIALLLTIASTSVLQASPRSDCEDAVVVIHMKMVLGLAIVIKPRYSSTVHLTFKRGPDPRCNGLRRYPAYF